MDKDTVQILLEMKEDLAAVKTAVEGLAGPSGRVTKIENSQTRQWWVSTAILPVLALTHAIARKLGVQI